MNQSGNKHAEVQLLIFELINWLDGAVVKWIKKDDDRLKNATTLLF